MKDNQTTNMEAKFLSKKSALFDGNIRAVVVGGRYLTETDGLRRRPSTIGPSQRHSVPLWRDSLPY